MKFKLEEEAILWKDRKRYLGLPISFTRYSCTASRILLKKGLFSTTTDETLLYRILDFKLKRTLGQKIFGVGTLTLTTADGAGDQMLLQNIKESEAVRQLLGKLVEEERDRKRFTAREMYSSGMGVDLNQDLDNNGIPDRFE